MGRVQRKRKLKSFDPAYKGPRPNFKDTPMDLAPKGDGDNDDGGKRRKKKKKKNLSEEQLASSILRDNEYIESLNQQKEEKFTIQPRQSWETRRQFEERLKLETSKALIEETRKLRKTSVKRKEYLTEKKKKKKQSKTEDSYEAEGARREAEEREKEIEAKYKDNVAFGEVADRPPQITAVPKQRSKAKIAKSNTAKKLATPTAAEVGQKRQMELLRERAINAYKSMKKSRTQGLSSGRALGNL